LITEQDVNVNAVATDPSRLEMRGIGKSFGSVSVLQGVDLELGVGEVLALLGQNGAGKSTLVKILGGDYARDAGMIKLDGAEVHFSSPRSAIGQGVRILPQELSVMPEMTVAENILIGDLPASFNLGISRLDRKAMDQKAMDLLADLGLEVNPRALLKSLAVSEQRIVEIARAISGQAKVLVMDEPTAALTEPEVNRLFEIIRRLKTRGVSIIYISHRMDEVFEISDRVLVLRDGRVAGRFETARAFREEVFAAMLGDAVEGLYPVGEGGVGRQML
jgi:ribose transport system ATP-binding protein